MLAAGLFLVWMVWLHVSGGFPRQVRRTIVSRQAASRRREWRWATDAGDCSYTGFVLTYDNHTNRLFSPSNPFRSCTCTPTTTPTPPSEAWATKTRKSHAKRYRKSNNTLMRSDGGSACLVGHRVLVGLDAICVPKSRASGTIVRNKPTVSWVCAIGHEGRYGVRIIRTRCVARFACLNSG